MIRFSTACWHTSGALRALKSTDQRGRPFYIAADVGVDVPELQARRAVLSSVRV